MPFAWMLRAAGLSVCCAAGSWGQESLTVVPGRIPYMQEAVGHVVVTTAPDHPGEELTLEVSTSAGTVLGTGPVVPGQRSAVEIPLGGLPEGVTAQHCRLLAGGSEVAAVDVRLTRLPPKPHAVQIDNRRRGLMVDGLPFFPFGFFSVPPGGPEGNPSIPPDQVVQGFNLYAPYSGRPSEQCLAELENIRAWMDRCAEVGMKVNYDLRYDCHAGSWEAEMTPKKWQTLRTEIEALRDHPALLSWYIADEPHPTGLERLAALRRFVSELDPYHPVTVLIGDHGALLSDSTMPEWREVTDVAWLDIYPVKSPSIEQNFDVAATTANLLARLDRLFAYSLPVWHTPQCYGSGFGRAREPSAQELRAMTYAGLISGATAIQYFAYMPGRSPKSPRLWAEAARLAQETMELTPFLLSEEPRRGATASRPEVLVAGWQDRGMALMVALNVENAPASLQVTLADSNYSGRARVLFENRQVEVCEGRIKDTIEALGTRVYQIPEGPFPPDRATLDPGNLRNDPSFEDWVNAGSPTDGDIPRSQRDAGSTYFLDSRTAVHGRHSLRLTASGTKGMGLNFTRAKLQATKRYRVSLWAKADRPEVDLRLALPYTDRAQGKLFALTTEWKQYSIFATAQEDVKSYSTGGPKLHFDGPGTVWVDMLQIVPAE